MRSCTGDGAGILLQVPHEFFKRAAKDSGIKLPGAGEYGVGMVFLPPDADARAQCETLFRVIKDSGAKLLGWRDVPVKSDAIGALARTTEPFMRQVFIARGIFTDEEFERRLYVIRKCVERAVRESAIEGRDYFYIPSLSSSTIVFRGSCFRTRSRSIIRTLTDSSLTSAMALVHARFSTNTFLPGRWPIRIATFATTARSIR